MKIFINALLLLVITQTGFSQRKLLEELKNELLTSTELKATDYLMLSRTTSEMATNEKNETVILTHYKLLVIINKSDKIVIEEYQNGNKSNVFEIKNSNIFKFLKNNFRYLNTEKLKKFEYGKDGSKLYLRASNSGQMKIDISYNRMSYHSEFEDFLLDFSSNSKLKLVKLILNIEHELSSFYTHHPFYVETN